MNLRTIFKPWFHLNCTFRATLWSCRQNAKVVLFSNLFKFFTNQLFSVHKFLKTTCLLLNTCLYYILSNFYCQAFVLKCENFFKLAVAGERHAAKHACKKVKQKNEAVRPHFFCGFFFAPRGKAFARPI